MTLIFVETGKFYKFCDMKFGNQQFKGACVASLDSTSSTIVKVTKIIQFFFAILQIYHKCHKCLRVGLNTVAAKR